MKRPLKTVLFALADIGDDFGRNIFASEEYVAWKTDYEVRQVRRIFRELEKPYDQPGGRPPRPILICVRPARGRSPAHYRIDLDAAPKKPAFIRAGKVAEYDTDSSDEGTEADNSAEAQTLDPAQDTSESPDKMSDEGQTSPDIGGKTLDESAPGGQNVRETEPPETQGRTFETVRADISTQRADISRTKPPANASSESTSAAPSVLNDQCLNDQYLNEAAPASPDAAKFAFGRVSPISEVALEDAAAAQMPPISETLAEMIDLRIFELPPEELTTGEAPPLTPEQTEDVNASLAAFDEPPPSVTDADQAPAEGETAGMVVKTKRGKTYGKNDPLFSPLAALCFKAKDEAGRKLLTQGQRFQIINTIAAFREAQVDTDSIDHFEAFWRSCWQSGQLNKPPRYQPPAPVQVRELWPQFVEWLVANSARLAPATPAESKDTERPFENGEVIKWRGGLFRVLYNHGTYGTVEGLFDQRLISVFRWQQQDPVTRATDKEISEALDALRESETLKAEG